MSGNNDNKDLNYNSLPKKEQENVSAQKAGQLASKTDNRVSSEPNYKNIKNTSIPNEKKNKEEITSKKIGDIDKATGGKVGRVAKPLNDSGAIDTANKSMDVAGGKLPDKNLNRSLNSHPSNNQTPGLNQKPNFAKNGINNDNNVPNGNSEGANKSRLRNIFGRRNNGNSRSLNPFKKKSSGSDLSTPGEQLAELMAQGAKRVIKMAMLPLLPFALIMVFLFLVFLGNESGSGDIAAADPNASRYGDSGYFSMSAEQKEFYDRVNKTVEDYKANGKEINGMYITSTYFVLNGKKSDFKYDSMTQEIINELAEGMLGGSTVYSKDNYKKYLVDSFFKKYLEDDNYEQLADDVFDYIDEYMKMTYKEKDEKKCSTTTGGSCKYTFNGIHSLNSESIDLSNIQVRLMSSSNCPGGTDNVALNEPLIPFEEYVLGVGYGELGPNYNEEVAKVHLIAARSFALSRPYYNRGAMGVKLIQENNKNIIQLRSCVADQVYCNTKQGCSADYDISTQPMIYSGTTHPYVYQQPLSNYPNSNLEKAWKETMGMVGVDKDGKAVLMPYALNNNREDPQDPRVWLKWAQSGKDYKAIILAAYPQIEKIQQASCNSTTESTENGFLKVAKEIWTEITNTFTDYTNGNQVPPTRKTIDCSSFVDWVLYKYGYEDFKGWQKVTQWFVTTDLNAKYGWEEIPVAAGEDVTSKLKPGDILVRDPGNNNGHMNIIVEIRDDGSVWGYDCGDDSNWKSSRGGKVYNVSSFVKGDAWGGGRPGKIIRVSNQGTGGTCETAESGDWSEWRQNGPAPWKNIPLGKSNRTIGSHGCYVTSIAIQIARSGVKTNISNFNPGTFVTELNKFSNSFDGYGNFNGIGNVNTIVPNFKTVANHVSIGNTKQSQIETIQKYIDQGYYVILNVDNGGHWVAVTGTTKDNIKMVDPGRTEKNVYDVYSVNSCVGITVFDIK